MAGFNQKCPYCNVEIDVQQAWTDNDYKTDFTIRCPGCDLRVHVDVFITPEFKTSKRKCDLCNKVELTEDQAWYCDRCKSQIDAVREMNRQRSENG
jgi:hypothetical protein